jgi:hypothetical protein
MPSLESTIASRIVLQSRAALPEPAISDDDHADAVQISGELANGHAARPTDAAPPDPNEWEEWELQPQEAADARPETWKTTDALSLEQLFGPSAAAEDSSTLTSPSPPVDASAACETAAFDAPPIDQTADEAPATRTAGVEPPEMQEDSESDTAGGLWLDSDAPDSTEAPESLEAETEATKEEDTPHERPSVHDSGADARLALEAEAAETATAEDRSGDPDQDAADTEAGNESDEPVRTASLGEDPLLAARLTALLGKQRSLIDRMSTTRQLLEARADASAIQDPFAGPLATGPDRSVAAPQRQVASRATPSPQAVASRAPPPAFIAAIAATQLGPPGPLAAREPFGRPHHADPPHLHEMPLPAVVRSVIAERATRGEAEYAAPSPWPGLVGGFGLSLLVGGILYVALQIA